MIVEYGKVAEIVTVENVVLIGHLIRDTVQHITVSL